MKANMFKILILISQMSVFFSAYAARQGDIHPKDDITVELNADLGEEILASSTGVVTKSYTAGSRFANTIYCPEKTIDSGYEIISSTTNLPPSLYEAGYLKLTDEIDVQVNMYTGNARKNVPVPFTDVSNNNFYSPAPNVCDVKQGYVDETMFSGGEGQITFKVRKPIINGISVSHHEIAKIYAKFGSLDTIKPGLPNIPVSKLFIDAFVLRVSDKCTINEGQLITVEFGDVSSTALNGNNYIKNVPIQVECEGGSFDTGSMNVGLSVSGKSTPFSNELLNTDKNDLGILLKHNGEKIIPGSFYPLPSKNGNSWNWDLIASPMGNPGKEISEGEFNASATVVAKFE